MRRDMKGGRKAPCEPLCRHRASLLTSHHVTVILQGHPSCHAILAVHLQHPTQVIHLPLRVHHSEAQGQFGQEHCGRDPLTSERGSSTEVPAY